PRGPQFWLHDTADGPRRAGVRAAGVDGNHVHVILAERGPAAPEDVHPLGPFPEALFALDGDTPADLLRGLARLREGIENQPLAALARRWWHEHRPDPARPTGL